MSSLVTDDLERRLRAAGCPLERWGTGAAKSVARLAGELAAGECRLHGADDGLTRIVTGAQVRVRHQGMTLVEDHQRYTDGRADPVRRRDLQASVGEKMLSGEQPLAAAVRALREELGCEIPGGLLQAVGALSKNAGSQSYPGLRSRFETWTYDLELPARCFAAAGYVEVQCDKTSVWVWVRSADAPF